MTRSDILVSTATSMTNIKETSKVMQTRFPVSRQFRHFLFTIGYGAVAVTATNECEKSAKEH